MLGCEGTSSSDRPPVWLGSFNLAGKGKGKSIKPSRISRALLRGRGHIDRDDVASLGWGTIPLRGNGSYSSSLVGKEEMPGKTSSIYRAEFAQE